MTEQVQLAIIGIVVPSLAALGALLVSLFTRMDARKAATLADQKAEAAAAAAVKKADVLIAKADQIHTLTNSNLSIVTNALEVANAKMIEMQKLINALSDGIKATDKAAATNLESTQSAVANAAREIQQIKKENGHK